jgi:hypothetical protein
MMKYNLNAPSSTPVRHESGSSSGNGRRMNFVSRPKQQEGQKSVHSQKSPVTAIEPSSFHGTPQRQQQQQHYQLSSIPPPPPPNEETKMMAPTHLADAPNDFSDDPPIPISPGGTPPKKIWEGAYSKFLRGSKNNNNNTNKKSASPTLSSSLESISSLSREPTSSMAQPFSHNNHEVTTGKKAAFSLIPGTKRLVSRSGNTNLVQEDDDKVPPFPTLRVSPRSTASRKKDGALDQHLHGGVATTAIRPHRREESIRGGKLFKTVFNTSSNNIRFATSDILTNDYMDHRHRRYRSMDALDVPLRKGVEKSNSVSLSPVRVVPRTETPVPANATAAADALRPHEEIEDPNSDNLDDLLASAASIPTSHRVVTSLLGGPQRAYSTGGIFQSWTADGTTPMSGYLHPTSYSPAYRPESQFQPHDFTYVSPNVSHPTVAPPVPTLPSRLKWSTSDISQNVGLTLDDSDRSDADDQVPQFGRSGDSSSPPSNLCHSTEDIKKVFTNFHNASEYSRDSSSAYLGGNNSSVVNLAGVHDAYLSYHASLLQSGRNLASSGGITSELDALRSFRHLETVDEQNISIHKDIRLLKPVQGTEAWQSGRRYLIAPAALSACPLPAIKKLGGGFVQSASEAAVSSHCQGYGTVDLGVALMTYVGEKHHLSLGKFSSCRLVLRQNYLFEYEATASINGLPRGYVHLQYAVAYAHTDFHDVLELQFYASPCAKSDHRTLRIQVQNREERDHWIKCLNTAANLRMEDIWEITLDRPSGAGRYASVYPARRRFLRSDGDDSTLHQSHCALKIVDKNEFWRRVVKGRERSDTLVRELAVQATITAKCGGDILSFLQLRGFFETSDNVVIELELLNGKDLFEHIRSKGCLSEDEAGTIIRDVLLTLDGMNRIGLAHRDVKPANILVADPSKHGTSVKLCDFGMSTFVGVDGLIRGRCGTPGYVAPEILTAETRAGYGNKVDVFSAGVTLYLMLSGVEPFYGETEKELVEDNTRADVTFPSRYWGSVSSEAKHLVQQMVQADPNDRISAKEALKHPWLTKLKQSQSHLDGLQPNGPSGEGVCSVM